MSHTPETFTAQENVVVAASLAWAWFMSDWFRAFATKSRTFDANGEVMIGFTIWCLCLWWLSKRRGAGWSFYWSIFAFVSFVPFADMINAALGGVLGLRG